MTVILMEWTQIHMWIWQMIYKIPFLNMSAVSLKERACPFWPCVDTNLCVSSFVKGRTVSATLVALSHSIRQGPDAHTGAECVLRATYQERGTGGETGEGTGQEE